MASTPSGEKGTQQGKDGPDAPIPPPLHSALAPPPDRYSVTASSAAPPTHYGRERRTPVARHPRKCSSEASEALRNHGRLFIVMQLWLWPLFAVVAAPPSTAVALSDLGNSLLESKVHDEIGARFDLTGFSQTHFVSLLSGI